MSRSNLIKPIDKSNKAVLAFNNEVKQFELTISSIEPESKERIKINASGIRFDVFLRIFSRNPNSRLGRLKTILEEKNAKLNEELADLCDDFDLKEKEFYFNCDPDVLKCVLIYYKTGDLHFGANLCPKLFEKELTYWQLSQYLIDDCCIGRFTTSKETIQTEMDLKKETLDILYKEENYGIILPELRKKVWFVLDKPLESTVGLVLTKI